MNLGNLCLVTAIDEEFKIAASLLPGSAISNENEIKAYRGYSGERRITVLKSGMGARGFADRLANHLCLNNYDALIVVGFAGGLNPRLKIGDAVIYDLCHQVNTDRAYSIACDAYLAKSIFDILQNSMLKSMQGSGVTVSRVVTGAGEKIALGIQYNALAADMESYGLMAVCAELGLPAAVLRIISDVAETDLPDFNNAIQSDGRINKWKVAAEILRMPLASMRFIRNLSPALNSFKECLKALLNAQ
jgi:nucleoside phosphorylase